MIAKITAYNNNLNSGGCSDFSMNVYWGEDYRTEFYLCGDLGRSTFEDIIETTTDATGQTYRLQNTSIERFNLSVVVTTPLLQLLKSIDKCDVKELTFIDTADSYSIKNIDIDDSGSNLDPVQLVNITFEDEPISKIQDVSFVDLESKIGYWDNNNNGSPDIDGEATYQSLFDYFTFGQLYYEADGVTPATSGDVQILAYANRDSVRSLIGIFNGKFGDILADPLKWQTTQSIYNYFNPLISQIGHTEPIRFDKRAFAQDNGYYSDEIEDRAVNIEFELSINGSQAQKTTLSLVYSVWGAFSSSGVQSNVTAEYGITTIGKQNLKNTLSTVQDIKVPLPTGTQTLVTNAVLDSVTSFNNKYTLDIASSGENGYSGSMITAGGYTSSNFRGAFSTDNFTFAPLDSAPIDQSDNILNYTTGNNPYRVRFDYKYDRQTGLGGFTLLGNIPAAGDAEVLLNGTVLNNFPSITPSSTQVIGTQTVILPDTNVNTIRLTVPTTTNREIFTEFQLQLKPLF